MPVRSVGPNPAIEFIGSSHYLSISECMNKKDAKMNRPTARVNRKWAGVETVWEQKKLKPEKC